MKLDKRFHCFACQADGDVIDYGREVTKIERRVREFAAEKEGGFDADDKINAGAEEDERSGSCITGTVGGNPDVGIPGQAGNRSLPALEDDLARLQGRLYQMFGVDAAEDLFLATQSKTIPGGLVMQIDRFMQMYPDTRLVIVDTLQKVREIGNENYSYAVDYQNITALKDLSDKYNICRMVVHHTRKMEASDSFDTISGTTGLLGAADGAVILQKKKRIENMAVMQIVGRDQEDQELSLAFDRDRCYWNLEKAEKTVIKKEPDPVIVAVADFMKDKAEWTGSATELLTLIPELQLKPNVLGQKLNIGVSDLYNDYGVIYTQNERSRDRRTFTLKKISDDECDKVCDKGGTI